MSEGEQPRPEADQGRRAFGLTLPNGTRVTAELWQEKGAEGQTLAFVVQGPSVGDREQDAAIVAVLRQIVQGAE